MSSPQPSFVVDIAPGEHLREFIAELRLLAEDLSEAAAAHEVARRRALALAGALERITTVTDARPGDAPAEGELPGVRG